MKVEITKEQYSMVAKALRHMISNLQYERHQAQLHNCSIGSYDKEIEDYRQLKQYFQDGSI